MRKPFSSRTEQQPFKLFGSLKKMQKIAHFKTLQLKTTMSSIAGAKVQKKHVSFKEDVPLPEEGSNLPTEEAPEYENVSIPGAESSFFVASIVFCLYWLIIATLFVYDNNFERKSQPTSVTVSSSLNLWYKALATQYWKVFEGEPKSPSNFYYAGTSDDQEDDFQNERLQTRDMYSGNSLFEPVSELNSEDHDLDYQDSVDELLRTLQLRGGAIVFTKQKHDSKVNGEVSKI